MAGGTLVPTGPRTSDPATRSGGPRISGQTSETFQAAAGRSSRQHGLFLHKIVQFSVIKENSKLAVALDRREQSLSLWAVIRRRIASHLEASRISEALMSSVRSVDFISIPYHFLNTLRG